jgi:hypothetical protein
MNNEAKSDKDGKLSSFVGTGTAKNAITTQLPRQRAS